MNGREPWLATCPEHRIHPPRHRSLPLPAHGTAWGVRLSDEGGRRAFARYDRAIAAEVYVLSTPRSGAARRAPVSLLIVAGSIVFVSASAALVGVNSLFSLISGALIGVVVLAAIAGYGRPATRTRATGLGLVVAAIASIQLTHLWNDGVGASSWPAASMLLVLTVLGSACLALARQIEAAERP